MDDKFYKSLIDGMQTGHANHKIIWLLASAEDFLRMSPKDLDYQKIADTLKELAEAQYVAFHLYNREADTFTTACIAGEMEDIRQASDRLRVQVVGRTWKKGPLPEPKQGMFTVLASIEEILPDSLLRIWREEMAGRFRSGQVVLADIVKDDRLLGDFTIIMPEGKELQNRDFVGIFTRQVGLLLERVRLERELVESQALLQESQEMAQLGRWEWDHASGMLSFAPGINELFEISKEIRQVHFREYFRYIHPDDLATAMDENQEVRGGSQPYDLAYRIITGRGNVKWINEIGHTHRDEKGMPLYTVGTVQDVTKLKESEKVVQRLLSENETVFHGTKTALFLVKVEEDGNLVYIKNNRFHHRMTGVSLRAFRGKTPRQIFGEEMGEIVCENYRRCIQKGKSITYEETLTLPAGTRTWRTTLTPVFEKAKPQYIVGSAQDITEQKKSDERIGTNLKNSRILLNVLMRPVDSIQEYLDYALSQALKLTGSQYGYIYLYDEQRQLFTLNSWSGSALEACRVAEKKTEYPLAETGIWGEVIRQRKMILINDFGAAHPLKRGYPEGHVPLTRFLSIPVFDGGKIMAVVGVANRETDYAQDHSLQLTLLMNNVWTNIQRKISEDLLRQEKELFRTTLLSIGDGILATDNQGKVTVMNDVAATLTGWPSREAVGRNLDEVFQIANEETGEVYPDPIADVLRTGKTAGLVDHTILVSRDGRRLPIAESAAPILNGAGDVGGIVLAFRDITVEKQKLSAIEYLSYHDPLTGLYNRAFYEEELRRLDCQRDLPISIVMADVNCLKLANDAFGHQAGDELLIKAAEVMRSCCRREDIIARVGGDEFILLLPRMSGDHAGQVVQRIRDVCRSMQVGLVPLSISLGWETKTGMEEHIEDIQKKAEDRMYRQKLFDGSIKGKMINSIIRSLYETHALEEHHSQHVSGLCAALARGLSLEETEVRRIARAGLLHDIGKIAIDSAILNKEEKLTQEEWREIRRHPETGYRILCSAGDLPSTADSVLAHHERWDGRGYPKNLKGREIPLAARIIALADTYDTMTSNRSYRKALPAADAAMEIGRNAGTQFDPELVRLFLELHDRGAI